MKIDDEGWLERLGQFAPSYSIRVPGSLTLYGLETAKGKADQLWVGASEARSQGAQY